MLFESFNVNVDELTVLAFSALLNVALTVLPVLTTVASLVGVVAATLSAGAPLVITMLKALLAVWGASAESATWTVKLKVPLAVGVPVIAPVLAPNDRPPGRAPLVMAQVYGFVPPVAASVAE